MYRGHLTIHEEGTFFLTSLKHQEAITMRKELTHLVLEVLMDLYDQGENSNTNTQSSLQNRETG